MYDKKHREWAIRDLATQYRILCKLIKDKQNEIDIVGVLIKVNDSIDAFKHNGLKTKIEICILTEYHLEVLRLMDQGYSD